MRANPGTAAQSRSGVPPLSQPPMIGTRTNALIDELNEVLAA